MPAPATKGALVRIPAKALREISPELRGDLRQHFATAGLRFSEEGASAIRLRSDGRRDGLILELPLQTSTGRLRTDAQERLERELAAFDATASRLFRAATTQQGVSTSRFGQWELGLMLSTSPDEVLQQLAEFIDIQAKGGAPIRLVRLLSTDRLFRRLFLLELIDNLLAGLPFSALRERARGPWVSGLVELQPQIVVCPPLVARNQPLAAALMTPFLSAVLVLPSAGGFQREVDMSGWPTGLSALRLGGPGKDVYTGIDTIPTGHAQAMLAFYVDSANRLLQHLTAPERWVDDSGNFQPDERRMAWTSIRIGLDAVSSVGAAWTSRQAIWEAFRALGVLAGFWETSLATVLTPNHIRRHVLALIPNETERLYATGIIDKYDESITTAFGKNAAEKVLQIRNLVHGVARKHGQDRTMRLKVLYELEQSHPELQLVQDVATLWWQVMLSSPETLALPGQPPWRVK